MPNTALPVAILFSGRGSNLKALTQSTINGQLNLDIRCVICNHPSAAGIQHAIDHGLPLHIIDHRQYSDKVAFEQGLHHTLLAAGVELIILAGFMRILSADFVDHFAGKIINLHPSLLPKYRGLNTHHRALTNGDKQHGSSVHLVESELDNGVVIAQYKMPIQADDTPETLAQRLAPQENRLLQAVTALFARGDIQVESQQVMLNNQPLNQVLLLDQTIHWPINEQE